MEAVPNQTLYISNLNEKIKPEFLKKSLYMIFSQYGRVKEIVATRGLKLRGQAWVVFEDTAAATNALRGKQNFLFQTKPMKISFAKNPSTCLAKKEGIVSGGAQRQPKRGRDSTIDDGKIVKEQRL
eukprot:gene8985-12118_t